MRGKLWNRIMVIFLSLALIFPLLYSGGISADAGPSDGGENDTVVFSGTDDAVAAAGSNFDLLNGVSASRDGADLTVRVTGVTASGDDDFVFTDGMSRLDTVKKDAVYTATVKADLKAGKVIVEWTKDGEPFNGEPAIDGEPTDVVPSFENKTVPPETPEPPEKIKTGDNENLAMWLLLAAVCAEAAFALIRRKYADR
jgi:hypothetical protein